MRVRWRWLRKHARLGVVRLGRAVNHWDTMHEIESDGRLTGRYLFMLAAASAIAILGLLNSSPDFVVGAMLLSPLMAPIVLLGFSLCALDYAAMRRALISLAVGVALALAITVIIVMLSPLREATPAIMARTRPNLFDLLVAIFSGLAGGYAMIHRKGAAIVGVAIATSLLPPLNVVGFGIATGSPAIAGGASFLFMTNLLAIALSVTSIAWLHGFATVNSEKSMRWQTGLVIGVFVALSLPLGFALRDIAYETRAQNIVRENALFPFDAASAEISNLAMTFPRNDVIQIQQTVLTHQRVADAEQRLTQHYEELLKAPVRLQLNQILVDQDQPIDAAAVRRMAENSLLPLQKQVEALSRNVQDAAEVKAAVPFRTLAVDVDPEARTARVVASPASAMSLAALREAETVLRERFGEWDIRVTPPIGETPLIAFDGAVLSEAGEAALDVVVWALVRWEVSEAEVIGRASLGGASNAVNRRLALQRAETVAAMLNEQGFTATASEAYGAPGQAAEERAQGVARFQAVEVRARRQASAPIE